MKVLTKTVRLGNGNENTAFPAIADKMQEYLKEKDLNLSDVVWLQSSSDHYITLTGIAP